MLVRQSPNAAAPLSGSDWAKAGPTSTAVKASAHAAIPVQFRECCIDLFRRGGYAFEGVVVADHKHNPHREDTGAAGNIAMHSGSLGRLNVRFTTAPST